MLKATYSSGFGSQEKQRSRERKRGEQLNKPINNQKKRKEKAKNDYAVRVHVGN